MIKDRNRVKLVDDYIDRVSFSKDLSDYYFSKKILVTGGAGAIGSNLVIALSRLVNKEGLIIVVDNLSAIKGEDPWNLPSLNNVLFVKGDIRDDVTLKRVFREKPNMVFHLAAFFANQNSVDYPERSADVDINGIIKLLDYSQFTKVDRFVYASSGCAIYGSYGKMPLKEDFISLHLTTPYQINKMTGEMYCNFYFHHYGLKITNCRFFNSYGPGEVPGQYRNVIPNFIYWALNGYSLPITGSGEETRDFTYVLDLVQGLVLAGYADNAIGQSFNLASARETKIIDLAEMINSLTKNQSPINLIAARKWDTKKRLLASIELANKLIGYQPIVNLEEGIERNIQWFKTQWERIQYSADFPPGLSSALKGG